MVFEPWDPKPFRLLPTRPRSTDGRLFFTTDRVGLTVRLAMLKP